MFDILILSNGPGEITTWVRLVVKFLRAKLGNNRDKNEKYIVHTNNNVETLHCNVSPNFDYIFEPKLDINTLRNLRRE